MNFGNAPYYYDHRNLYNSMTNPSDIHAYNVGLEKFFRKYLYERAMSVLDWKLPEEFNAYYFNWVLWCYGFIGLLDHPKFGKMCQFGTFEGYDIYYYPKYMIFNNPAFEEPTGLKREIDKTCVLLNLKGDFTGIEDICSFYSSQLAVLYESFGINAIQAKNTDIYGVPDKKTAEELKKVTDLVMSGKPATFISKDIFTPDGNLMVQQFKQPKDYFGTELLDNVNRIFKNFDDEIGIPETIDKKERVNETELNMEAQKASTRLQFWVENLKKECRKAKTILDIDIDVNIRYNKDMETEGGETVNGSL